jgi:signal transduction histidine kinase
MEKHGQRLIRIIEDMLTISRLESVGSTLNFEPFNVRGCIQDAIDHLAPMLESRQVHFDFDFPPSGGTLHGDRFYWDQIFTNLLENAIKENPGRALTIRLSGRWSGDQCTLTLSDDGVGIPSHDIPFVFKRFFRGHKHHGQTIKGTGLGLSIVRRAIEAHSGTIDLRSTPGIETIFTIEVPSALPLTPIEPPAQNELLPLKETAAA